MRAAAALLCLSFFLPMQDARIEGETLYPRFDRTCYRNMSSAELNECLKTNIQSSVPRFKSGIPGIYPESIDPLLWPKFVQYFGTDLIKGSLSAKDIYFLGFSKIQILAIRTNVKDPQKMLVELDWSVPRFDVFGNFRLDGRIGNNDFQGSGPFSLNMTGITGTWKITGRRKKGEPYMKIISFRGRPEAKSFKVKAPGSAFGNEDLGDLIVRTINQGWRIFFPIASHTIDKIWGSFCREKLNRVFLNVPYDELFPLY